MSYYTLGNICEKYNEPTNAILSNVKYTDTFVEKSSKIKIFNENITPINSYEYIYNNFYPSTKSYNQSYNAYPAISKTTSNIKTELASQEKKLLAATEAQLKRLTEPTNATSTPVNK